MNINDTRKRVKRALSGVNDDFPGENPLADIAINCGASFDEIAQWLLALLAELEAMRAERDALKAILRTLTVTDVHICHGHTCERCLHLAAARAALEGA